MTENNVAARAGEEASWAYGRANAGTAIPKWAVVLAEAQKYGGREVRNKLSFPTAEGKQQFDAWYAENAPTSLRMRSVFEPISTQAGDEPIRAALKAQPAPTEAQDDGLSPVYAWLERSTRNSPAEVANAARTMMAFYQGAEFPEAEQGDPLDTKLPCDVVIGNMTIRKGVSLGVLVGKAQRDNTRLRELLPQPTPEQIAAFNAFLQNHITDAGEIVAAQGEDSARLVAMLVDRDTPPDNRRDVIDHDIRGNPITREMVARASAETGGVKP